MPNDPGYYGICKIKFISPTKVNKLFYIFAGNLFLEMGWFYEADKMFYCVLQLCKALIPTPYKMILLCHTRYLNILDCVVVTRN